MGTFGPIQAVAKTGETLVLRHVEPEDAAALLAYLQDMARSTDQILSSPDEMPTSVEEETKLIRACLDSPRQVLIAAWHGSGVAGALIVRGGERRREAHVGTIGVGTGSAWRGKGVGRALMEASLSWIAEHPLIMKACLSVFSSNDVARALYGKLGFAEEGRRPGQAQVRPGEFVDEIMMGRWVKPAPRASA